MSNIPVKFVNEGPAVNEMGFLQRIAGIVTSPGKVMENLAEKPRILFPLILTALSLVALYASRLELYKDFMRQSTAASSKFTESLTGVKMTAEMIEQSVSSNVVVSFISRPIMSLISWLFITVVFFAIFKIAGGKGKFKNYLSVTGYAYVITFLYYIIVFAVSFFTGSLNLTLPITSLATLLDAGMRGNFLFGVFKGLEIFSIWYFSVIAIGLVKVSGFKKLTTYGIVAGVFMIGLLIAGVSEISLGAMMG